MVQVTFQHLLRANSFYAVRGVLQILKICAAIVTGSGAGGIVSAISRAVQPEADHWHLHVTNVLAYYRELKC